MANSKTKLSAAVLGLVLAAHLHPSSSISFWMRKRVTAWLRTETAPASGRFAAVPRWLMVNRWYRAWRLTQAKCDRVNAIQRDKTLAWVERDIKFPLTEPQKAGIAFFCPYNFGPGKRFPSTFYKRINTADRKGAGEAIRWWIKDGDQDCWLTKGQKNGCYGQVERRDQESALACWGIGWWQLKRSCYRWSSCWSSLLAGYLIGWYAHSDKVNS